MEENKKTHLEMHFSTAFRVGLGFALGTLAVWGVFVGIVIAIITAIGVSLFA